MNATDKLTRNLTAFRDFADLLSSLRTGYVPTLRKSVKGWKLARIINAHGYRTYMV